MTAQTHRGRGLRAQAVRQRALAAIFEGCRRANFGAPLAESVALFSVVAIESAGLRIVEARKPKCT